MIFTSQTRKWKLRDVKEIAQMPWWWNQELNPDNLIPISVSYPLPYSSCQSPGLTALTHHSSSGAVCFPCLQALLASLCTVGMARIPGQLIGHYDPPDPLLHVVALLNGPIKPLLSGY